MEKVKEEQKKNPNQNCSLGLCECPGKKRGGQPPFTWEEDENHQNSPYFSLPRHKVRASRNTSEDKSRNSSSDTSLSLHNFIKHYKQGFISACMKISSCLLFLCTNCFFGKKQSQEGTRPRQRASSLSACLWGWDLVSVLYMHSNVYCPLSSKAMTLVYDCLHSSSSPNVVIVENGGILKSYKISP